MSNLTTYLSTIVDNFATKMNKGVSGFSTINSLISAFSIEDRQSKMSTGSNVRKYLSDSTAQTILNNRQTQMRNGNYDKAMEDLIDDIIQNYGKGGNSDTKTDDGDNNTLYVFIALGVIIVLVIIVLACKRYCGIDLCQGSGSGSYSSYSDSHHHIHIGGGHHGGDGGHHGGGGGASSTW